MNDGRFPPLNDFVKINVYGASSENPLENGNSNGIGILARNEDGRSLWGIMGPLKELNMFQSQLWAIHVGMRFSFVNEFPPVHMESDNMTTFNILLRQKPR